MQAYLLDNYPVHLRLAVILGLFLIPLLALGSLLLIEIGDRVEFLEKERLGTAYITTTRNLIEATAEHRGMNNAYLNGDASFKDKILDKRQTLDAQYKALMDLDQTAGKTLHLADDIATLQRRWVEIKERTFELTPAEAFASHTALVADLTSFINQIADISNLILDSDLDSYYLIDAIVHRLPILVESMGQARGLGAGVAANQKLNVEARIRLSVLLDHILTSGDSLFDGLNRAFTYNPAVKLRLES